MKHKFRAAFRLATFGHIICAELPDRFFLLEVGETNLSAGVEKT